MFDKEWTKIMDEKIIGYGIFESVDGEVFVGYFTTNDNPSEIEEDNFYKTELEATQVALAVANEKLMVGGVVGEV